MDPDNNHEFHFIGDAHRALGEQKLTGRRHSSSGSEEDESSSSRNI